MNRLIVAADIHGWYPCWQELASLLTPGDGIAVVGDLFDNVYGNYGNGNYWPEQIRLEWRRLAFPKFYVYGNCDSETFFPHHSFAETIDLFGRRILLHHGHVHPGPTRADIVVQGHSHRSRLEYRDGVLRLNPGSVAQPRDDDASYAVMTERTVSLVRLRDHRPFHVVDVDRVRPA